MIALLSFGFGIVITAAMLAILVLLAIGAAVGQWLADRRRPSPMPPQTGVVREPVYRCTACDDTFPDRRSAEAHIEDAHGLVLTGSDADEVLELVDEEVTHG